MDIPKSSFIQEQRDLFHELQQAFESDRNARALVETQKKEAKTRREVEESKTNEELKQSLRKVKETQDNIGCVSSIVGISALIFLVLVLTNVVQFIAPAEAVLGIFVLFVIFILLIFTSITRKESLKRQHQESMKIAGVQYDQTNAGLDQTIAGLDRAFSQKLSILQLGFVNFVNDSNIWGLPWEHPSWSQWKPATEIQLATRIGTFLSRHNLLPPVPAFINCPGRENILFKVSGTAKTNIYNAIQSIMLRLLAFQPPGKVRFTLIDPMGLGQNVAMFMQLTDHSEKLVGNRAWSETRHIEQQLADLSEHMGYVIQKYLRGQFSTIEEYNMLAGEVAEPYRVLVVTDFPAKFSEEAVLRLVEIATNGPRCGVFTIIMQNTPEFYPELEQASVVLSCDEKRITWQDPDFRESVLQLDEPPTLTLCNTILHKVGKFASEADDVKVPFERVMPSENMWWKANTQYGISVPLGRAGASKDQYLELGKGTAQHVLVAGKTGAGKTNLLHVLLINLALTYSPDELELCLIDFKTVGFTFYARFQLPHARVIATQSEREFALSVLKGLDTLLEERKNHFSNVQVQDIVQYRIKNPNARMPRILLLVDEFQEFFTVDDKIAEEAKLLLDRLVRQGRGFGMHVMLGSQTLAGAYTLANATIGQMAVRIALQCQEADSRLILSDDNPAARLLSRPGEAIYNASNGMIDGNNPFQCAWLDEVELERYLERINIYAQRMQISHPWQQIIFEGDANANVEKNAAFDKALITPYSSVFPQRVTVWIGDPISIKEAVSIQFIPQTGNNFIMIGQQDEAATGMYITTLLSLAAQYRPEEVYFCIFDFMLQDDPFTGQIHQIAKTLPHQMSLITRRTLPFALEGIDAELTKRLDANTTGDRPIYLFIYGLQRVRDLRPVDDLGLSAFGDDSASLSLSKRFTNILRNGPECGIHTIAWCDSYNNVNRSLERGMLREFELRVAFQMSTEDSINLIDTPIANSIGGHRAFLRNEDTGQLEKFRPYSVPSSKWLDRSLSSIKQKCGLSQALIQ